MASNSLTILFLLSVITIGGAAYFGYPWVEEFAKRKTNSYLEECEMMLHRMFREMPRKKMIIIIAGSTFGLGLIGFVLTLGYGWINIIFTFSLAAIVATCKLLYFRDSYEGYRDALIQLLNEMKIDMIS